MTSNEKRQITEAVKAQSLKILKLNRALMNGLIDSVEAYAQLGKCYTNLVDHLTKILEEN